MGIDDLSLAIKRLCDLVTEKGRTLNEADAEDVPDDIQKLLEHLQALSQEDHTGAEGGKQGDRDQWSGRELRRDLRTIECLALGERDIALNKSSEPVLTTIREIR